MSLLMDALRRAEAAKQEPGRAPYSLPNAAADEGMSLEPIPGDVSRGNANPLPDLAAHLDAVDADLASAALPEPRPTAAPPRSPAPTVKPAVEARDAVRNAFAAKQAVPPPSRLPLWLALGTLGVAGIAIGGYVWYQLNTMNRSTLAVVSRPVAPAASQPLPQPADQARAHPPGTRRQPAPRPRHATARRTGAGTPRLRAGAAARPEQHRCPARPGRHRPAPGSRRRCRGFAPAGAGRQPERPGDAS